MTVTSISFFRFGGAINRLWAFGQMQFARAKLRELPDIGFHKLFGTGTGEGFTPVPNLGVYAVLATWPDLERARSGVAAGLAWRDYRAHAAEHATVYLSGVSSRGLWDGCEPFGAEDRLQPGDHVAVLTRATLKPRHLLAFWSNTPDISACVRAQTRLRFRIGMGEVPWLQQVTFSIWEDAESMTAFAYRSSAHADAVRRVREGGWFKEELYARFRVLAFDGAWEGRRPLVLADESTGARR